MYGAGILLGPLGTAVYFKSGFAKSALDDFIFAIKDRLHLSIRAVSYTHLERRDRGSDWTDMAELYHRR